ncbi:MAG TPA: IS200/IS605 family transposase [Thermodesulfovibrionales bacterium]|nr:IS200/IS605 family transposase [Thermodesulfovibrionales bacterium]
MGQDYKHAYTSVFLLNYHFVWTPRRQRKVLSGKVKQSSEHLLKEKALELGLQILALEVMPDHIHLCVNAPPTLAPQQIMHRLKAYSSRRLRHTYPALKRMPSMWTRSYFVSTAGTVSSETITRYIQQQSTTA